MNFTEKLIAATLLTLNSDGRQDPAEFETIKKIGKDFQIDEKEFNAAFEKETTAPTKLNALAETITDREEGMLIMEACVQVAFADKVVALKEIGILLRLSRLFNVPEEFVVSNIAIFCQNDRDIKIEGSDSDFNDEIEIDED